LPVLPEFGHPEYRGELLGDRRPQQLFDQCMQRGFELGAIGITQRACLV
jgi:hypothetical protein